MAVVAGHNTRVFLGGQDISKSVRAVRIESEAGHITVTTVEFLAAPTMRFNEAGQYEIHLDGPAAVGPLDLPVLGLPAGLKIRAMTLVGDIPTGPHS